MKYQLVLQFPISEDFDFDAIIELETELTFELGSEHIVDGHDFGADEMNIFVLTNSPELAFRKAFPLLNGQLAATLRAAYRAINSDQFKWVHPSTHEGEFSVA